MAERVALAAEATPKFPRPKILIVDTPDVTPVLQQRGYAAVAGSFGQPIVVPCISGYQPLSRTAKLPGGDMHHDQHRSSNRADPNNLRK
jgi:hypothetical protein